jgi:hypothetical protein
MPITPHRLRSTLVSLVVAFSGLTEPLLEAAAQRGGASDEVRQASQAIGAGDEAGALAALRREIAARPASMPAANLLDVLGETAEARRVFQRAIDTAADPAARAAAQRAMAMSYAFAGDCAGTTRYEEMVIAYWVTREAAEPQNAFYQQGEMANEAARVCIDAGDLDAAERLYRRGTELGLKEPAPQTHPRSLWEYRLAHALARLAARRGDAAEAQRQVAAARRLLDGDREMAAAQERFFPYLTGYVALYTGDLQAAERELTRAIQTPGNQGDPFMHALLGMTYERLGRAAQAREIYTRAYGLATAHNPPAAFTRPFTRARVK